MKFIRAQRENAIMRLPLVALIDVILFLLIYFMIAGSFAGNEGQLSTTVSAGRSGGGGSGATLAVQVLRVQVEGDSVLFRIGNNATKDRASLTELLKRLPKEVGMVVKVDDNAPVEGAAAAIQACKDAGFTKVTYVAGK